VIIPVHEGTATWAWDWYHQTAQSWLHRYELFPSFCIALETVHSFYILFTAANQKAPSKTVVHKIHLKVQKRMVKEKKGPRSDP